MTGRKTYVYRNGRMVQVERKANPFTGEVGFEVPYPLEYNWGELLQSYDLFVYGGPVGHTFKGGTYRLDGSPLRA